MSVKRFLCRSIPAALLITTWACDDPPPPPMYQSMPVSTRDIVVSVSAAGIVEPVTTLEVKSKASGEIVETRVETGDQVTTGDLLVRVDPRIPTNALLQAEADLEVAQAQLTNAESQLRRANELYKTQSITEQEFETANLQAATAKAQLVRAERALEDSRIAFEDTEVRAPSDGVIMEKNVEIGTVISSATREVGGGTILLQMANLDTVQVRTLVDETDIGKASPGLDVSILVDAFPNQPFRGNVLKIEPQATVEQNVTMFPVLIRIANPRGLLRPGMNAEVEIHVGSREGVLAIPNAALRTDQDLGAGAEVLGLDPQAVRQQVASARRGSDDGPGEASMAAATAEGPRRETMELPGGRTVELPDGITANQAQAVFQKMRSGGGPQALSADEREIMAKVRGAMGRAEQARPSQGGSDYLFGGNYVVFVVREGKPQAVPIRTGLTDLDYSEVVSGLTEADTVLILPSASLIASQREWQERIARVRGGGLPGVQRQSSSSQGGGR